MEKLLSNPPMLSSSMYFFLIEKILDEMEAETQKGKHKTQQFFVPLMVNIYNAFIVKRNC
jgi:hypothetical protein